MRPVKCFGILCLTWTLSAQLTTMVSGDNSSERCKMCPAGEFQKTCSQCAACPAGSFTTEPNQEEKCFSCFQDCKPKFHLKVIQNCTNKSNLKCVCEKGYTCIHKEPKSDNCRQCNVSEATTAGKHEHLPHAQSGGRRPDTVEPCSADTCGTKPVTHTDAHARTEKMTSLLPLVLTCLIGGACMALLLLVYVRRNGNQTCFKKALALLLCNKGGKKASQQSKESSHHFPRGSFSAKPQLPPVPSANLGPVHVHNPGTIIFSLLSQFTGQVGPTTEGGNTAEMETGEGRGCPMFQPAPSPSIHISEEEINQEADSIFFPFQEQGKDCHVSKEEVL